MRNYEVTFIIDPVLSGDELKKTADKYIKIITDAGCEIVNVEETGLQTLAYPINKRSSGVYYTVQFSMETGEVIDALELAMRRDEKIMRFLTIKLDKYAVQYNQDKRDGKIGEYRRKTQAAYAAKKAEQAAAAAKRNKRKGGRGKKR